MRNHYKKIIQLIVFGLVFLAQISGGTAQAQGTFSDVKLRFTNDKERKLEFKDADLMLDDAARRLRIKSSERPLDVSYDDVQRVVVEVNTFGERAGFAASFFGMFAGGLLFGNAIATSIDKPFKNDHFIYLEVKKPDGTTPYLLNVGKDSVPQVLKGLQAAFGERVVVPAFTEKAETMDKKDFTPSKSRVLFVATDKQHPLPELKTDKALVVVHCPATILIRVRPEKSGHLNYNQGYALYANGVPVGLNAPGTYTFFYLDPGDYFVVSQVNDVAGLRMKLEAGKDYYLTQTPYVKGIHIHTFLTRHSKELVMFEVAGSLWADWKIDEK
jgi:hypothetical protein